MGNPLDDFKEAVDKYAELYERSVDIANAEAWEQRSKGPWDALVSAARALPSESSPATGTAALVAPDQDPFGMTSFCGKRACMTADAVAWLREDPERYMFATDDRATRALVSRENLIAEEVTVSGRKVPSLLLRARSTTKAEGMDSNG